MPYGGIFVFARHRYFWSVLQGQPGKSALLLAQDSPAVLESQPDACLEPSPKRLKCEKGKELRSF